MPNLSIPALLAAAPSITALVAPAQLGIVVIGLAACLALALRLKVCNRGRAELTEQVKTLTNTENSAIRQLRLGSHNLRAIGMSLQGHAEHMLAGGPEDIQGIAKVATEVFDIADYMHEWSQHVQSTRILHEDAIYLGNELDEALSTITLTMQPGRRRWLVEPDVPAVRLRADRRALRHVLTRALSVSVRSSGHEDAFRLRLESTDHDIAMVIEPQRRPDGSDAPSLGGTGPDLRLTLARALMEAHGGTFDVAPGEQAGVRVRIGFPLARLLKRSGELVDTTPTDAAHVNTDDRLRGALVT